MENISRELDKLNVADDFCARIVLSRLFEGSDKAVNSLITNIGPRQTLHFFGNLISQDSSIDANLLLSYRNAVRAENAGNNILITNSNMALAKKALSVKNKLPLINLSRELETTSKIGAKIITPEDSNWPVQLSSLGLKSPFCLWLRGDISNLQKANNRSVAIVGTRNASNGGNKLANNISRDLCSQNFAIVSGGAWGIDASAHRAAIGHPNIAFLAGGVDKMYPAENEDLLLEIMNSGGLIASENPPFAANRRLRFLNRNRLIAALASATVVVEAPFRSGALSTATHALDLNRPLGAFPGNAASPQSTGCNRLIRDGKAVLLECTSDIIELAEQISEFSPQGERDFGFSETKANTKMDRSKVAMNKALSLGADEGVVFDTIPFSAGIRFEQISRGSGIGSVRLAQVLGNLEINGLIKSQEDKWVLSKF